MSQSAYCFDGAVESAPHVLASGGQANCITILADRPQVRDMLREDAEAAGYVLRHVGPLAAADTDEDAQIMPLGDVVVVDCPYVDADAVPALVRLDERVARSGAMLITSTSAEGLADIFGCLERSLPQILVDPTRAERIVALGTASVKGKGARVRDLTGEDRLALIRLTQQVERIAHRLEGGDAPAPRNWRMESPRHEFRQAEPRPGTTPSLPAPTVVRRLIKARQARLRFFDGDLFADPAWDILLDLTAAAGEGQRVCVTSLCIAAGVPTTTALRWIAQMTDAGLLVRVQDPADRRRAFIELSRDSLKSMAAYFADVGAMELLAA